MLKGFYIFLKRRWFELCPLECRLRLIARWFASQIYFFERRPENVQNWESLLVLLAFCVEYRRVIFVWIGYWFVHVSDECQYLRTDSAMVNKADGDYTPKISFLLYYGWLFDQFIAFHLCILLRNYILAIADILKWKTETTTIITIMI